MAPSLVRTGLETLLHLDIAWWDLCGPCAEAEVHPHATEGPDASAFAHHLSAAHGYPELGLPLEAWNELEAIEPPPRQAAGRDTRVDG